MTMSEQFERWRQAVAEDPDLAAELNAIAGNEREIYERFATSLTFGTAGLRGVLGAGTNRMNIYTVRRATQGLAAYVKSRAPAGSVAIAYDTRRKSRLFAEAAASVLAANGLLVYLFSDIAPTPLLSWAVRYYGAAAGIVVTASHNPAEYNGYKVYGPDGCQLGSEAADAVLSVIEKLDLFEGARVMPFAEAVLAGLVRDVGNDCIEGYYEAVLGCRLEPGLPAKAGLTVAYTPLNGVGNLPVRRVLKESGVSQIWVVPEQEHPDSDFPTCPKPNPELPEAMTLGLATAERQDADLLIGTDPDCDRIGVAARHPDGDYRLIGGNEVGVLMADYIGRMRTQKGTMPDRPVLIKSIVTTSLTDRVAESYGVETIATLTGFKHMGERIARLEARGELERFIFAYEESCGYLPGSYVRDKDGVSAAMLIAEVAAYHKLQGRTLFGALDDLYARFGVHYNQVDNIAFPGADGMATMTAIMDRLFSDYPKKVAGSPVVELLDCRAGVKMDNKGQKTPLDLPPSDVLILTLADGCTVIIRPSGTEPKLKIYYMVRAGSLPEAQERAAALSFDANLLIK